MNASVFSAVFLLLSFASSAVYAAPADEAPDPPDVPKLNTQPWVPARYRAVRENLLGKECGILFVGDSITECLKAVNFGVSGDRTDSMLWRMEDTKLAVKTSPRYCVLLAGTNNIGRWKGRQAAAQTVKGIREIAVRLLKKFPETRLILMEVTPYGTDPGSPLRRRQEEINRLLRRLELPRTTILSINGSLLKPDGTFREGMFRDHVHLTEKGYQAWADALLPLLNGEG
ncbi:MAG: hypothetical protein KIA56_01295 [Akkermansia muciniphila]|nr:hypothetical protein [Akkermansia muciniphila]